VLARCVERGIKVVVNAGGLNPAGLAHEIEQLAARLKVAAKVAHIDGDDLIPRLAELQRQGVPLKHLDKQIPLAELQGQVVTANAYLGAWGIVEALNRGADIVICPRVTDAALALGPAAWKFGWARDDWDKLAAGIVAGHIIECGAQCTGGNYSFFKDVPNIDRIGFPIAEMHPDGTFVITKHPGTGGLVSIGTITAQLLYEIQGTRYLNPDVTTRFDSIRLQQEGPDRVRVFGIKGEPPPPTTKVCINYLGGYRNSMTFVLAGLDIEDKARIATETLWKLVGGKERFAEADVRLTRSDRTDPETNDAAFAHLRITVKDPDGTKVGRAFSGKAVEMALANYPGFFVTTPPSDASPFGVYWPALVPSELIEHRVHIGNEIIDIPSVRNAATTAAADVAPVTIPAAPTGATERLPLGTICGARSGDKGGDGNVGVWARNPTAYAWLERYLTVEKFKELVRDAASLPVERHALPNLLSLNFIVHDLLGDGVAASTRSDPQAKSFGEYVRAKLVDIPRSLLAE
jgi:hypothetical protein